jgi:hypothetical protein
MESSARDLFHNVEQRVGSAGHHLYDTPGGWNAALDSERILFRLRASDPNHAGPVGLEQAERMVEGSIPELIGTQLSRRQSELLLVSEGRRTPTELDDLRALRTRDQHGDSNLVPAMFCDNVQWLLAANPKSHLTFLDDLVVVEYERPHKLQLVARGTPSYGCPGTGDAIDSLPSPWRSPTRQSASSNTVEWGLGPASARLARAISWPARSRSPRMWLADATPKMKAIAT